MTTIDKVKSGILTGLFLVVMALGMATGCSSSEETDDCDCAEGDWNCKECEINISDFNAGMYWIIIDMVGSASTRKKFVVN